MWHFLSHRSVMWHFAAHRSVSFTGPLASTRRWSTTVIIEGPRRPADSR